MVSPVLRGASDPAAKVRAMRLRLATAALAVGALCADSAGAHGLAYYLLVAAVPVAALAALTGLGAILDGSAAEPADRGLAALSALVLPFLLLAATTRPCSATMPRQQTSAVSETAGGAAVSTSGARTDAASSGNVL